jgi:hypothetical protein
MISEAFRKTGTMALAVILVVSMLSVGALAQAPEVSTQPADNGMPEPNLIFEDGNGNGFVAGAQNLPVLKTPAMTQAQMNTMMEAIIAQFPNLTPVQQLFLMLIISNNLATQNFLSNYGLALQSTIDVLFDGLHQAQAEAAVANERAAAAEAKVFELEAEIDELKNEINNQEDDIIILNDAMKELFEKMFIVLAGGSVEIEYPGDCSCTATWGAAITGCNDWDEEALARDDYGNGAGGLPDYSEDRPDFWIDYNIWTTTGQVGCEASQTWYNMGGCFRDEDCPESACNAKAGEVSEESINLALLECVTKVGSAACKEKENGLGLGPVTLDCRCKCLSKTRRR